VNQQQTYAPVKVESMSFVAACWDTDPIGVDVEQTTVVRWNQLVRSVREEYLDSVQNFPWVIGFSGGKDSTVVVQIIFEALLSIPPSQRIREVHIVSNDTMVESPAILAHLDQVTAKIENAAKNMNLPVIVARTRPETDKTFWVLLIGKGYPSPNQSMRWCTDRLKIQPTSTYIKKNISRFGSAIIVLGVRRDESISRQRSINKYVNDRGKNLTPHGDLAGAYIYRPIVELSTDDVWEILGTFHAPWGGNHKNLFQLYRDAEGGECPVVMSPKDASGCGTGSSRFGCWTCTVVEKDRSLQGFIDSGNQQYKPLVAFRDWLKYIRNKPEMRQALRRNGKLTFDAMGRHIPGPFTLKARKLILDKLLAVQKEYGSELITDLELDRIYQYWKEDLKTE